MDGRIEGETRRRNKQEQERKRHVWRTKVWQQSQKRNIGRGHGRWKQYWVKQHDEQNTKQRKEEHTNQSHINLETDRANRLKQRSNAHARNKRSKVENTYKIQPSLFFVVQTTSKFSTYTHTFKKRQLSCLSLTLKPQRLGESNVRMVKLHPSRPFTLRPRYRRTGIQG